MRNSCKITIALSIIACVLFSAPASGRRKGYRLKVPDDKKSGIVDTKEAKPDTSSRDFQPGSFMVASQCENCNKGYRLDQIVFTGFDKNQGNSKESFFIINKTDRELTGVALYIEYVTLDGRQLNKRYIKLSCSIPPGETRKADIPSWDTQRSFYYHKSIPSKRGGNPFDIKFDPIAYYLRF